MRRMVSTNQSDYINDLSEVAEKGLIIGTYPTEIDIINEGIFNWQWIEEQIEDEYIDFENHTFNAYLEFAFPRLLAQYGLGDGADPGYIDYVLDDAITMPDSVVDLESLQAWMQSEAFITALNETGYYFDDAIFANSIAQYITDDPADSIVLVDNELKVNTYIECIRGEGEQIIGASDPIGEPTLKTGILEVEKFGFKVINSTPSYDEEEYQLSFEFDEELEQGLYLLLFENIGMEMDTSFACLLYVKSEYGFCSGVPQSDPDTQPYMFIYENNVLTYTGSANGLDDTSCKAIKIPL